MDRVLRTLAHMALSDALDGDIQLVAHPRAGLIGHFMPDQWFGDSRPWVIGALDEPYQCAGLEQLQLTQLS